MLTICVEGTTSPPIAMNNAFTKPAIIIQLNTTGKISIGFFKAALREYNTASEKICERMNPTISSKMPDINLPFVDD